jgi:hypothetical protein
VDLGEVQCPDSHREIQRITSATLHPPQAASQPDTGRWEQFTVALLDATRDWPGRSTDGFRDFIGAVQRTPAFQAMATLSP